MTRETKVGLLIGMGVILVIGIIVSDHLAVVQYQEPAALSGYADQAQSRVHQTPNAGRGQVYAPRIGQPGGIGRGDRGQVSTRTAPVLLPGELGADHSASHDQIQRSIGPRLHHPNGVLRQAGERNGSMVALQQTTPRALADQALKAKVRQSKGSGTVAVTPKISISKPKLIIHEVRAGESLWEIADHYYGDGVYWKAIAKANSTTVKPKGQVRQGARLVIPNREDVDSGADQRRVVASSKRPERAPKRRGSYTVGAGDTLSSIAEKVLGDPDRWRDIYRANRELLSHPDMLSVGQKLKLPAR